MQTKSSRSAHMMSSWQANDTPVGMVYTCCQSYDHMALFGIVYLCLWYWVNRFSVVYYFSLSIPAYLPGWWFGTVGCERPDSSSALDSVEYRSGLEHVLFRHILANIFSEG